MKSEVPRRGAQWLNFWSRFEGKIYFPMYITVLTQRFRPYYVPSGSISGWFQRSVVLQVKRLDLFLQLTTSLEQNWGVQDHCGVQVGWKSFRAVFMELRLSSSFWWRKRHFLVFFWIILPQIFMYPLRNFESCGQRRLNWILEKCFFFCILWISIVHFEY